MLMKNAINWFEIPASDFKRAVDVYERIFEMKMFTNVMMGYDVGFFHSYRGVGIAVVHRRDRVPSKKGTTVYLNAGDDLSVVLSRVEGAGGNIPVPKTHITPQIGYFAVFLDTEGNKVALHSMKLPPDWRRSARPARIQVSLGDRPCISAFLCFSTRVHFNPELVSLGLTVAAASSIFHVVVTWDLWKPLF
jgi:predicted enzyme related to lactoylglutathione lyase